MPGYVIQASGRRGQLQWLWTSEPGIKVDCTLKMILEGRMSQASKWMHLEGGGGWTSEQGIKVEAV